jgi:hypothetical protein
VGDSDGIWIGEKAGEFLMGLMGFIGLGGRRDGLDRKTGKDEDRRGKKEAGPSF